MKQLIPFLFTLLVIGNPFTGSAETLVLKEGSVLTYEVRAGGSTYDFIVTITSLAPNLSFDYVMSAPANLEGSVTITEEAMENAFALVNYFRGGEMTLEDATTVFLCRECYKASQSGNLELNLDGAEEDTRFDMVVPGWDRKVLVDGQEVEIDCKSIYNMAWNQEAQDADVDDQLMVMDDYEYPLILAMWLDFAIVLKAADNVDLRP